MYGVAVLLSEYFVAKLSPSVRRGARRICCAQAKCATWRQSLSPHLGLRRVDVVCLKGSSIPMAIYTDDRSNALHCSREAVMRLGEGAVVAEFQRRFGKARQEAQPGK